MKKKELSADLNLFIFEEYDPIAIEMISNLLDRENTEANISKKYKFSSDVNYFGNERYSLISLLKNNHFASGGFCILRHKNETVAFSGCYKLNNLMICGVLACVATDKLPELFQCHFKYILPYQFELSKALGCGASVITINTHNSRVSNSLVRVSKNSNYPLLKFDAELIFNHCTQNVLYLKNSGISTSEIISALSTASTYAN